MDQPFVVFFLFRRLLLYRQVLNLLLPKASEFSTRTVSECFSNIAIFHRLGNKD